VFQKIVVDLGGGGEDELSGAAGEYEGWCLKKGLK
jgi:hypothetical protein